MKIGGVLLLALTLGMWIHMSQINKKKEQLQVELTQKEQSVFQKELAMNEMLHLIESVEDQMDEIVRREQLVSTVSQADAAQGDKKLLENLKQIDALVLRTKHDMAELQKRERQSELRLGLFEKRISKLSAQLKAKEVSISDLKAALDEKEQALLQAQADNDGLQQVVEVQQISLAEQRQEMAEVHAENKSLYKSYLAIGTYDELKNKGLVKKEGGFLGIFGRKLHIEQNTPFKYFMEIDRRDVQKLRIEAKALKLVSKHPSQSYQIIQGENESESILEITDNEAFWKWSKRLVISKNT